MEILYVWFNKAASGVLDKTGVNLSPEYSFDVRYDGLYLVLYLREWKGVENIFRNDVIENVTAIVGKNGTGKTSILKALQLLTCGTVRENTSAKYKHYYEERLQQSYRIIVLRDDIGKIKIYHNLKLFRNNTEFEVVDVTKDGLYGNILRNCTDFSDITKVYITNSSFGSAGGMGYAFSKVEDITLTPSTIENNAAIYYDKLYSQSTHIYSINEKYIESVMERNTNGKKDFYSLCDILYIKRLFDIGKASEYIGNFRNDILIASCFKNPYLGTYSDDFNEDTKHLELYAAIYKIEKSIPEWPGGTVIKYMYAHLLLEIMMYYGLSYIDDMDYIPYNYALQMINHFSEGDSYIEQALKGINDLETIVKQYTTISDDGYKTLFCYRDNPVGYRRFVDYIFECFYQESGFVLTYLNIEIGGMSSGERAFQNIFTWLNLIPLFSKIYKNYNVSLRGTVLLLIDELDLYLHPDWQTIFMKKLLEEIRSQFSKYKVQIVFATHSPLCISDIPRENIVYLQDVKDGRISIDKRENHQQSFGRDVFTILNDTFYLNKHTMGAFAEQYINDIIKEIDNCHGDMYLDRRNRIYESINMIGDPLLKAAVLNKYFDCFGGSELNNLRIRKRQIEERIAVLERRHND